MNNFKELKERIHDWGESRNLYNEGSIQGQIEKVLEEAEEAEEAMLIDDYSELIKELGDVFISSINACKVLGIEPELCIAISLAKIEKRSGKMIDGTFVKDSDV